jgi:hypothetical protein
VQFFWSVALGVTMHDRAELTDRISALQKVVAEMASRVAELQELRDCVASAERKSCSNTNKQAVRQPGWPASGATSLQQRHNLALRTCPPAPIGPDFGHS